MRRRSRTPPCRGRHVVGIGIACSIGYRCVSVELSWFWGMMSWRVCCCVRSSLLACTRYLVASNLTCVDALVHFGCCCCMEWCGRYSSTVAHSALPNPVGLVGRVLDGGRVHLACPWTPECGAVSIPTSVPLYETPGTRFQLFLMWGFNMERIDESALPILYPSHFSTNLLPAQHFRGESYYRRKPRYS